MRAIDRRRAPWAGLAAFSLLVAGASLGLNSAPASAAPTGGSTSSSSARTVTASSYDPDAAESPFPNLSVTVSQTRDLIQQGVTVSWTGGKQSTVPSQQTGGENFLQIAQCWGDEPGSNGTRPDRTTCQYGGFNTPGASRYATRSDDAVVADQDTYNTAAPDWPNPGLTAIPFVSATGKTLTAITDGKMIPDAPNLNNNEFFNAYTTNEVSWAGSGADGSGSASFELQTAQQSPGLGCGNPVTDNGKVTGQSCWLVIIPRGTSDPDTHNVTQSGLMWQNWKHHLAVKLDFRPVGLHCRLGAAERQLSGSELIASAVGQWQPELCNRKNGAIYSLLTGPESDAAAAANGTAPAPLALTSRPLASGTDNLVYAPITLTGVSIAFAIDEYPKADGSVSPEVLARRAQAFATLKLNPRLLAKLLTASYRDALPLGADKSRLSPVRNITVDPEFLAINDKEWADMAIVGVGVSDALEPLGRSDAASAIWRYIMADPDAADFLNGVPDKWGMHVNPYYSTNPRVNPNGVGLTLPTDSFPKADPTEYKGSERYEFADVVNLVTWRPFTSSLDAGGYLVLRGDPQALGSWDETQVPPRYGKASRSLVGMQAVIGLTDTAAAARYQVVQASLLNAAGAYVAPTKAALAAAGAVMTPETAQKQVVRLDPTSAGVAKATTAYPLAMPVYAAANPAMSDAKARNDYADFIEFAVTSGQTPGTAEGQLPEGYAPLPDAWKSQALAAAKKLRVGVAPVSPSAAPSSAPSSHNSSGPVPAPRPPAGNSSIKPAPSARPGKPSPGPATAPDPELGALAIIVPAGAAVGVSAAVAIPLLGRFRRRL